MSKDRNGIWPEKREHRLFSVREMRDADAPTIEKGTDAITLMGRAAHGAYQVIRGLAGDTWDSMLSGVEGFSGNAELQNTAFLCTRPSILVAAGGGNNGGDGWALACELSKAGIPVRVVSFSEKETPASRFYRQEANRLGVPSETYKTGGKLPEADLVADCLLGTGFHGEPSGTVLEGIMAIRQSGMPVLAMDINSGMNGDTGESAKTGGESLCTDSWVTMTIGLVKKGLLTQDAQKHIGQLLVCDIGILPPENRI